MVDMHHETDMDKKLKNAEANKRFRDKKKQAMEQLKSEVSDLSIKVSNHSSCAGSWF